MSDTFALDTLLNIDFETFSDATETQHADATTVTLEILNPDGTETTKTLADGDITHVSEGLYRYTPPGEPEGDYRGHWHSTGAVATAQDVAWTMLPKYGVLRSAYDVLTLSEAKEAITNNAGNNNDRALARMVTAVSLFLDAKCGPIVKRTITDELLDSTSDVLILPSYPVVSVTSVTEWDGSSATPLTAETFGVNGDYILKSGMLYRRSGGYSRFWPFGQSNIKVTYVAGRYNDTASVDAKFKEAAGIILANLWRPQHGLGTIPQEAIGPTYAMPYAAEGLLAGEMKAPAVA